MKSKIFTPGNIFYLIETVLTTKKKKKKKGFTQKFQKKKKINTNFKIHASDGVFPYIFQLWFGVFFLASAIFKSS